MPALASLCRCAILTGIVGLGCAKGSETQLDVPTEGDAAVFDSTFGDTGGDTARPDTGGDTHPGETRPLFDSDLFCGDLGVPNTCDKVIDVGSVPLAGTRKVFGNIPVDGGDLWYKVTFENVEDVTAHPHVALAAPEAGKSAFVFEVMKSCAKDTFTCGNEDAPSAKLTDFELSYPDATASEDSDAFVPLPFGPGGTVYVRVFRSGAAPDCTGFVLNISN